MKLILIKFLLFSGDGQRQANIIEDLIGHNPANYRSERIKKSDKDLTRFPEPLVYSKHYDEFVSKCLKNCLNLLDELPETVYRVCDLLVTIIKRNKFEYRKEILTILTEEISVSLKSILDGMLDYDVSDPIEKLMNLEEVICGKIASKAAVRIHLFTLLLEGHYQEMRVPCAKAMQRILLLPRLVAILIRIHKIINDCRGFGFTPKWLAPLLLLIDLYQKFANYTFYKIQMHQITERKWKWYDVVAGKWNAYSEQNNKIINDAYWKGKANCRITCGRQNYLINFSCMTQVRNSFFFF